MGAQGIIHRDIKPENILLAAAPATGSTSSPSSTTATSGGRAQGGGGAPGGLGPIRLADFGLSISLRLERAVTRAGTLDYMAPEVLVSHGATRVCTCTGS